MSEGAPHIDSPAGSATLLLVRHGESHWNAAGVLQGQECNGLSPLGFRQADAVAEYLAKNHSDARLFTRSDIRRVQETAAPSEERFGEQALVDADWREVHLGTWSGRPREDVIAEHQDELRRWLLCEDIRPGGAGETLPELRARVWRAAEGVAERLLSEGGGTAICFTHGGPIRTATAAVLGLSPGGERRIQPVRNGSVTVIRQDTDGDWRLAAYNRVDHLP